MKRVLLSGILVTFLSVLNCSAQIKILFDATKAETAGNADWVIDADLFNLAYSTQTATLGQPYITTKSDKSNPQILPTPDQSTITASTAETYWSGGLSYWGIDCVNKGYHVETLPPITGKITYGDNTNAQDLSKYDVYIVDEPNIRFTLAERNAIITFVKNGGGLYLISDHITSDRNNDGWDSPMVWNDLFTNNTVQVNPFGIHIDSVNVSGTWTNKLNTTADADSILNGRMGSATQVKWDQGATMTLDYTANSSVKGVFFTTSATSGNTNVLCAYSRFGKGKVVAMTDSSPFEDGTTANPNVTIYNGYTSDAAQNHRKLIMNATIWLASKPKTTPVEFVDFTASLNNQNNTLLNWTVNQSGDDIQNFEVEFSGNGETFSSCSKVSLDNNQGTVNYYYTDNKITNYLNAGVVYYRIAANFKDGSVKYSKIISVHPPKKTEMTVYPNPAKNKLMIHVEPFTQNAALVIMNTEGKVVFEQKMNDCSGSLIIPVTNLTNGNYFIKLQKADGSSYTAAFIKN